MKNTVTAPHKKHLQSKEKATQLKTILQYLLDKIATASMVTEATGVPQKNICRYKRDLELSGRLFEVEKKACEKTGFKAWYITCNPDYLLMNKQVNTF